MIKLDDRFLTIPLAHRGYHDRAKGRPENSREAIKAAIDAGYGIEIDLQLSSDNHAMVFHDYDLGRLTVETGPIRQRSANDLQAVSLNNGSSGIPSLAEILQIVAGRVPLLIELKDQDGAMGPNVGPLEAATAKALSLYDGPVGVMSFNPNSVFELARIAPEIPRGIVTSSYRAEDWRLLPGNVRDTLREIPDFDRTGSSFVSHEVGDLRSDRVGEIKSQGHAILCWTVRSPEVEAQARQVADNITFEGYPAPFTA